MIGGMDRKAVFYNPTVFKSDSGGTTNTWAQWDSVWCKYEQPSGFKTDAGSQDNLVINANITIRYSQQAAAFLNKDSKVLIGGQYFQVTDYQADSRNPFIFIKAVSKRGGTTSLITSTVNARLFEVTIEEAGTDSFVVPVLIGKTLLTIETGRAVPMAIIYSGAPTEREMLFDSLTGRLTVNSDALLVLGESFRMIYK